MPRLLTLICLLAAGLCPVAHAETTLCTEITSLPATITTQGVYCLKHDLTTAIISGAAITIGTNNVTIDCNDYKIGGLAAGINTGAYGIEAVDRVNLTIRHCGVRGFMIGINLHGSSGGSQLVEDNRVDLNTYIGMQIEGDDMLVRRNRILQTGGRPAALTAASLYANGSGSVTANLVSGSTPTGSAGNAFAYGINLAQGPYQVEGNFVTGMVPQGTGYARGIWGDSVPSNYRNNTILSTTAVSGFGLDGGNPGPSTCGDNTVTNFATDTVDCTDAGGNVNN